MAYKKIVLALIFMSIACFSFGCAKKEESVGTDMTQYAVNPTGAPIASGYYIKYDGKLYKADEAAGKSWFVNKPDMEGYTKIGEIKVVRNMPKNEMEGSSFDKGDVAYYDPTSNTIIVERVWITDYKWMILSFYND